jgi:hypothetical protein
MVVIAVLCLSLWSCGVVNPSPARAVVADAIAHKVAQTQALLTRQLALPEEAPAQVGSVKITHHHWTTIGNQPVVALEGTYRLQGGGWARSQQRQTRPFSLYLQRGDSKDQWIVVDPTA